IGDVYSEQISLKSNWRSKKNIVEFNNSLFERSPEIIHNHFLSEAGTHFTEIDNIKKAYGEVFQNHVEGDKSEGGLIDIRFIKKSVDTNSKEIAIEKLIETIESLQDSNFNLRDIAILIRNKNDGKLITDALMIHDLEDNQSKYKYDIISNESLFLKNSSVVNFLICALRTLSNFNEAVYQSELLYAWYVYLKDEIPLPIADFKLRKDNPLQVLKAQYDLLKILNLVDQIESIIRLFELNKEKEQVAYLLAFQDAILDFSQKENSGTDGFLIWWEENNDRAIQVSDEMEAMRLMTIHKSKGLQFKVVIIPFCNWKMDHSPIHDNIVWCDTRDQEPFAQLPYVPLKYKKDMSRSLFTADYWDERVKAYVDNLNLLYVAFTRAEEALYVISEVDEKKQNALNGVNDLLYNYFNSQDIEGWLAEEDHFHFGANLQYSVYEHTDKAREFSLNEVISNPWQERKDLSIRQGQFIRNEEVLERINEGLIVHYILSKVYLRKDFEKAIKSAEVEFVLNGEELDQIKNKLRSIFNISDVNNWFSDDWEVKNEMSIITGNGDVKIPDRVMIKDGKAIVVDFKTGDENERNNRQVNEYKNILGSMGYEQVEGYLLYINSNKVVEV
ncbi:MAG: hypothetical protein NWS46_02675, partial [Cyclobacteriaceae bacterium]|nr:hypothetical protein [Cyclobacteriaceae bacterium]